MSGSEIPETPQTRRAVALDSHGGPEALRIVEEPAPALEPGTVRIAVEAVGVNFGDVLIRQGAYRRDAPLSLRPGFEVAGRVIDADADGAPAPGTAVAAFVDDGGYASVVRAPASRVLALPEGMTAVDAAGLFIQGVTAWFAVDRFGRVAGGERVLIHAAAGGVGGLAVQLAKLRGAHVVATASTPAKRQVALARGADVALSSDAEGLRDALGEALAGESLDVVLDSVGGPLFKPGLRALGTGGRYVVYGAASQEPSALDARILMPKALEVSGFVVAAVQALDPAEPGRAFASLWELVRDGALDVERTAMPFEAVADAHRAIETRTQTGKIVLTV